VPGRASGVKIVGWQKWWHQLVTMGWQSIWIVGAPAASAHVIFILPQKIQKMVNKDMTLGYHLYAPTHAYANRRWGNPAGMQHKPVLGHRVV